MTAFMKKGTKETIVAAGIALAVVGGGFACLFVYSGMFSPFFVIESGSMMHSDRSSVGIIDTGDMVVVRSADKVGIKTYVDGYNSGYKKFGDYGDVMVYERHDPAGGNPVIHRAVIWLEWNDGHWSAPSLKDFPDDLWDCNNGMNDFMNLSGELWIKEYGFNSLNIKINLDAQPHKSGYVTKGDNNDIKLDQPETLGLRGLPGVTGLISEDQVLYVAGFEIPWIGCLKLQFSGKGYDIPPNSIPSLIATVAVVTVCILAAFLIYRYRHRNDEP